MLPGGDLEVALRHQLRGPGLLIVDEFQRMYLPDQAEPPPKVIQLLNTIARQQGRGRLLLLSSIASDGGWLERHVRRRLTRLSSEMGVILLHRSLSHYALDESVVGTRANEVVEWLGGNPRALRLLAAALVGDTLDELLGLEPAAWEARDREVSPELISRLELAFMDRTLGRLRASSRTVATALAVFRRSFDKSALQRFLPEDSDLTSLRLELMRAFVLEHRSGWFSLNPVARELAIGELNSNPRALKAAHRLAGEHYARHFNAQRIQVTKRGGDFVEARYHLALAGREAEVGKIAGNYVLYLERVYSNATLPADPEEICQRVTLLQAIASTTVLSTDLEFHLGRLFVAESPCRNEAMGVEHLWNAVTSSRSPKHFRFLLAVLRDSVVNRTAILRSFADRLREMPADFEGLASLYEGVATMLVRVGQKADAVTLLQDGLGRLPGSEGLVKLVTSTARLFVEVGRVDEAIAISWEGLERTSQYRTVTELYHYLANLLWRTGNEDQAERLLREGIAQLDPQQQTLRIYQLLSSMLQARGRLTEAIEVNEQGIAHVPPEDGERLADGILYISLAAEDVSHIRALRERFLSTAGMAKSARLAEALIEEHVGNWMQGVSVIAMATDAGECPDTLNSRKCYYLTCLGRSADAVAAAETMLGRVEGGRGKVIGYWLAALVMNRAGLQRRAKVLLEELGYEVMNEEDVEDLIITIWRESASELGPTPAFYFPLLYAEVTGRAYTLRARGLV